MLLFFSPAGMDTYFEEVLEPVQNRSAACLSGRCHRLCLRFAKSVTFGARLETERLGRLPRARGKGAYAVSIEGSFCARRVLLSCYAAGMGSKTQSRAPTLGGKK